MRLKIGILGSRGIPNRYGGFEQLAEYLSVGLVQKGHFVNVYSPHHHVYKENCWKGVQIIHCYDPRSLGTVGQFIYDLNCIRDARKKDFDIILFLGYTSSSVWWPLFPKKTKIISNMDGLEWKRSKYSLPVRGFLKYAEKLAIKHSHFCIADSIAIQSYLEEKYGFGPEYIPYGAFVYNNENKKLLFDINIEQDNYFLMITRMTKENNIETVLDGFHKSRSIRKFIVIGDPNNGFGRTLQKKFNNDPRIQFIGPLYDAEKLHTLKIFCSIYFHGHSVGGTNPSLLEAMASKALIAAHDNPFNRGILGDDAIYFMNSDDVKKIIDNTLKTEKERAMVCNNLSKIHQYFTWKQIVDHYESLITTCFNQHIR